MVCHNKKVAKDETHVLGVESDIDQLDLHTENTVHYIVQTTARPLIVQLNRMQLPH